MCLISGIYKILNKTNNKVYIGSAVNIKKRWRDHKWHLRNNKHHNSHLQSAWNKYGENSFEFIILLECKIIDLLLNESYFILEYNSFNNMRGYNVNDPEHKFLGKKHSDKTKQKLSEQKLGIKNPMYGKSGDKHPNYKKTFSDESKKKMSLSHLGIPTNRRNNAKLSENDIPIIRKMFNVEKISQPKIAKIYGVKYETINSIITGKNWSKVL